MPSREAKDGVGIPAQPVFLIDPTTNPIVVTKNFCIQDPTVPANLASVVTPQDTPMTYSTLGDALVVYALPVLFNGISTVDVLRTPQVFRMATANAIGATVLWDPAAGLRFRLMGFSVFVPSIATSVGGSIVTLLDAAGAVFYACAIGATTGTIALTVTLPGNGYLSTADDNILNINLSAAFTAGAVYINAWGLEE